MISLLYRLADAARQRRLAGATTTEQAHGRLGEDLAHRFLQRRGLTIVARNFRSRSGRGEVDLIARDGDILVFVEVKTRATADFGSPDRAVGPDKQQELRRAAADYLRRTETPWNLARFDLVNIVLTRPPEIEWFPDAFSARPRI